MIHPYFETPFSLKRYEKTIILLVSQNIPLTPAGQRQITFLLASKEQVPPFKHMDLPSGEHFPIKIFVFHRGIFCYGILDKLKK